MSKPFQPGERLSAKRLNLHSAANAQVDLGSASGSMSRFGSSVANVQHDLAGRGIWVRVLPNSVREVIDTTPVGGQRVVKSYGWEAIHLLDITEPGKARKWARNPAVFGTKDVDPVFASDLGSLIPSEDASLDYTNLNKPKLTPYLVARDPVSQRLIVVGGGGGGSFSASGKDMVLMILGDYNTYKDCPGVPATDPPKDANGNFCWPPYAWAAYKVCGYKYTKLFDMRDFGQWATELNGGGTGSYRRFFPAFWGWDTFTDGYDPTGSVNCAGVRFLGYNSQGALTCTCPTWLANVQCFKVTVKFIPEVTCTDPNTDCDCDLDFWTNMANLWGTEQTVILCNDQMGCVWQGDLFPFNITLGWSSLPPDSDGSGNCSWGPAEFDPCYPCDGFSSMGLGINSNFVNGGNGLGNLYDTFKVDVKTIRELINDCTTGPVTLDHNAFKGHCPSNGTSVFEWVKVECCSSTEVNSCVQSAGV